MRAGGYELLARWGGASALALLLAVSPLCAEAAEGAWAERVQVMLKASAGAAPGVERRKVRVWDFQPALGLDFTWEPAQPGEPGLLPDGTVEGTGRLVWRIPGSASYDRRAVFAAYSGSLRAGRPDGRGRLEMRSGEVFEGMWRSGKLEGEGLHVYAEGDRYEGAFRNGLAEGRGRLMLRSGESFVGEFVAGLRHGAGETVLPGGTRYHSRWRAGVEEGAPRPERLADGRVGGLVPADAAGGSAGRVEIGVAIDGRMNMQADMRYQQVVRDADIAIYPEDKQINDAWNGTGQVTAYQRFADIDWENTPAFVQVELRTTDGSRARLDGAEVRVSESETYRKPMLSFEEHLGCVGFRPTFSMINSGWGRPENITFSFGFSGYVYDDQGEVRSDLPTSRLFTLPVESFDEGIDISVEDVLRQAGVDTGRLASERFSCPSAEELDACRAKVRNEVRFGEAADFIWDSGGSTGDLYTTLAGQIDYDWKNDAGRIFHVSEPFHVDIALARVEAPAVLAESGDGFGGAPEARRFQDVVLEPGRNGYSVPVTIRGNRNAASFRASLKVRAPSSSIHHFSVAARFADGSTRESKPVTLFFFRPRPVSFESKARPAACYLTEEVPEGG